MLKSIACSFLFIFATLSLSAQQNEFNNPTPDWVTSIEIPQTADSLDGGGTQYLLYENQVNFNEEQSYFRHAIVLNSSESLADYSSLSFDYDPSYQSFTFHKVGVLRNGEYLDKLSNHIVNTYHRETSMERSIYDGSLTAVINLSDVRKGDVLVYSYSFTGRNKAFPNHIYEYQNLQFGTPVGRLYYSVFGSKSELKYKLHNGAKEPLRKFHGNDLELIWDKSGVGAKQYFSNTPSWYNGTERVTISNFDSWSQVLDGVLPFYKLSAGDKAFLNRISKDFHDENEEKQVLKAIQFVQDDIRYLGFEEGIHAFKPHPVEDIYNQRFGDCKDKSFLLAGILSSMGYEAFPILVHTGIRKSLNTATISPYSFNHCVVKLTYHGKEVYIDPTWNEQGGDLLSYTFPSYGYGLVLSSNSKGLDSISNRYKAATYIVDEFTIPEDNSGQATFVVKTEYRGADADDMRVYFGNNNQEEIKKDFLNYYNSVYSGIDVAGDVEIDDDRDGNILKTTETYIIDSIWVANDGRMEVDFYSLQLQHRVSYSREAGRDVPLHITANKSFRHLIKIVMPDSWSVEDSKEEINRDNYTYNYSSSYNDASRTISLFHSYKTTGDFIPVEEYNEFLVDHDKILEQVSFQVFTGNNSTAAGFPYYLAGGVILLLFAVGVGGSIFLGLRVARRYDPQPERWARGDRAIGGWLVLPAIGLTISPFILLYSMFSETDMYNPNIWIAFLSPSSSFYNPMLILLIGIEILVNCGLIIYTVLCLFMFYQKRSSAPNLISGLYLSFLIFISLDNFLVIWITDGTMAEVDFKEIGQRLLAVVIWVPYFQLSNRVKETFNRTLRQEPESLEHAETEAQPLEA